VQAQNGVQWRFRRFQGRQEYQNCSVPKLNPAQEAFRQNMESVKHSKGRRETAQRRGTGTKGHSDISPYMILSATGSRKAPNAVVSPSCKEVSQLANSKIQLGKSYTISMQSVRSSALFSIFFQDLSSENSLKATSEYLQKYQLLYMSFFLFKISAKNKDQRWTFVVKVV